MTRLAIAAGVLLVLLLALVEARVYQTVVTTTELDEPNTSQSERCRRQISGMRMNSCKRYMQPYMLLNTGGEMQVQQQCCQELRQVNQQCRCEALKQTVQEMQGEQQEQMQKEMMRKTQQLSDSCDMDELRYCQIRQGSY